VEIDPVVRRVDCALKCDPLEGTVYSSIYRGRNVVNALKFIHQRSS
jgi:hypothetical protein